MDYMLHARLYIHKVYKIFLLCIESLEKNLVTDLLTFRALNF